jgi:hypothetical protein
MSSEVLEAAKIRCPPSILLIWMPVLSVLKNVASSVLSK